MSSTKTLNRMRDRVTHLSNEFPKFVDNFNNQALFTGPSLHFHLKTVAIRARHTSAVQTLGDEGFFELLYATLTAWGMHRMAEPYPSNLYTKRGNAYDSREESR